MSNVENQKSQIIPVDINHEMKQAYLQYSMSVIVGRALPDVRDGLKPVHRRILFAQYEMGNTHDKPYKKSARVVGDVIGKYHPHGDAAVYDALVRMAQDFSMRYVLEDGQGNFGSIDGDSPAAMRYTEVRMAPLASELLADIDKNTVDFGLNYDGTLQVPLVLPAKYPNLLVNGSNGIAVGMATNIPPHNLSEVIDATIYQIDHPDASVEDLLQFIKGPDFPTAGIIVGKKGFKEAYSTGKGTITIKARVNIESFKDGRQEIVVTEIPYQVNKARLIEEIANLVNEKKIEGITDIRDESNREGLRIVISLKKGENAQIILNRLFKFSQLQTTFGIILLALDKNNQPVVYTLPELLKAFIEHRREVVIRRTQFDLEKAEQKLHITEGLYKALSLIDDIVATIKSSTDGHDALTKLQNQFGFTQPQADAILQMRLQRLTQLEGDKIKQELEELRQLIQQLRLILDDPERLKGVMKAELLEIKQKYGDSRRTQIVAEEGEVSEEDLVSDDQMVVIVSQNGYIKRIPLDEYRTQRRGGRGLKGMDTDQEDPVFDVFLANNKSSLLIFTNIGKVYETRIYQLPLGNRASKGRSIANLVAMSNVERITGLLPLAKQSGKKHIVMLTKKGVIKKTDIDEFANIRSNGIIAITTDLDDTLVDVGLSSGNDEIFIATRNGMSIRFHESELRPTGRQSRGVRGVTLEDGDECVSLEIIDPTKPGTILTVTEFGLGKRSDYNEYRLQSRGGKGIITQGNIAQTGAVVAAKLISDENELLLATDKGRVMRIKAKDIVVIGRNTKGVRLMSLEPGEKITAISVVLQDYFREEDIDS